MRGMGKWPGWVAAMLIVALVLARIPQGLAVIAILMAAGGLFWLLRPGKAVRSVLPRDDDRWPRPIRRGWDSPTADALTRRPLTDVQDVRLPPSC